MQKLRKPAVALVAAAVLAVPATAGAAPKSESWTATNPSPSGGCAQGYAQGYTEWVSFSGRAVRSKTLSSCSARTTLSDRRCAQGYGAQGYAQGYHVWHNFSDGTLSSAPAPSCAGASKRR